MPGVVDLTVRVLHVTDSFPPERGGVERVVEALAAAQARRGWRVTVLAKAVPEAPPYEARPDGVTVVRYPYWRRPAPLAYLSTWWNGRRIAAGLRDTTTPDLVHFHLTLASQGPLGVLGRRVPTVYSFYGPWHAEFAVECEALAAEASAARRRYWRAQIALQKRLQARLLRRVTRVVVLSEYSRQWVAQLASARAAEAVKIPGGIDPQRFTPDGPAGEWRRRFSVPDDGFLLVTVRRLVHRMGLDWLLEAMAALRQKGVPAHALLAGSGPLRESLEAQSRRLGLSDSVHFIGFVPDDDLPALYRAADLFVIPSRAEENFGLIALEAAACGAPVAALPSGSLPEILQAVDARYLAADTSMDALTAVLSQAWLDGGGAKQHFRHVVSARVRAEFAWERLAARFAELYATVGVR
jgi:glycosyltransferase involved in cell wall biosynthesis